MNERIAVGVMALLGVLSLWLAPWGTINRETGARSALLLLPNRIVDFTGRTDPVQVAGQGTVLVVTALALAAIAAAALLRGRGRFLVWLVAGATLFAVTFWGLAQLRQATDDARLRAFVAAIEDGIENPRPAYDVALLEDVVEQAPQRSLVASLEAARAAGLNVRRLPYNNAGIGLAAFLALTAGSFAILFGLRLLPFLGRLIDRLLAAVAVPATSILLALVAAALVVLLLQATPTGRDVAIEGVFQTLVGRLDTLWNAYLTLFADSLGTLGGFMESLKFATPLIFTGLAVGFGFQAGLFNIGAPGQMVLGAIFAMLVGVYLPGPRILVLPLTIAAAAFGGGLWGALPGWLKARFGAHEVINTILLNFVAAALFLFLLSSSPTFAAPAVRIFVLVGVVAAVAVLASLVPWVRRQVGRAPRLVFAVVGVLLLVGVVVVGLPRPNDAPVVLNLPFKVPGSEPKSHEISEAARLPQVPRLLGIDLEETPGVNVVRVNYALLVSPLLVLAALFLLPRRGRLKRWLPRFLAALATGVGAYLLGWLFGLHALPTAIPPTKLNLAFVIALLAAVFMHYFMWRTKWGYELRAVGQAPKAAEFGGASIARSIVLTMAMSGAFAGLTACHYVLGGALEDFSLRQSLPTNDGFDGIAVALLGGNTPLGVVLSAFLFGVLKNGGSVLNITFSDLTRDVVNMILALVVLFIAARGFLPERFTNPLKRISREDLEGKGAEAPAGVTEGSG